MEALKDDCQFSMRFDFTDNNLVVLIDDGDKYKFP